LNALSFVAVIVAIGRMRWTREPPPAAWQGGFWASWVEGYRFVAGFRGAGDFDSCRGAGVDRESLFVADAGLREGCPRRRPANAWIAVVGAGAGALVSTLYLAGARRPLGLGRVIADPPEVTGATRARWRSPIPTFARALLPR
jgi:hypothetical protein